MDLRKLVPSTPSSKLEFLATKLSAISASVIVLSMIFHHATAFAASSLLLIEFGHISLAVRVLLSISAQVTVLFTILAETTESFVSCTLFQVPHRSPDSCTLPAVEVVAYGTLAEFPILTQADALQR